MRVQRHVHHAAGLHLEVGGGEETLSEGQEVLEGRYPLVIYRDFNGDLMGFYSDFLWDLIVIQWDIHGIYPLVICYIAIENGPFIVDLPIKDGGFP